jgi:uncharacterized Zn finger protein
MSQHVAAVLYGIRARLDDQAELLFRLRKVDEKDLIAKARSGPPLSRAAPAADRVLRADGLSALFGLEMATGQYDPAPARTREAGQGPQHPGQARHQKTPPTHGIAAAIRMPIFTMRTGSYAP